MDEQPKTKRPKTASPTARSLAALRAAGWLPGVVEQTIPKSFIKRDLFGIADIHALKPGQPPLYVQATSASNVSARVTKILESEHYPHLVESGALIEVWGWQAPNAASSRWRVRIVNVATGEDTGLIEPPRPRKPPAPIPLFEAPAEGTICVGS